MLISKINVFSIFPKAEMISNTNPIDNIKEPMKPKGPNVLSKPDKEYEFCLREIHSMI